MKVKIEFSGGLELMFEKKKNIDLDMNKTTTKLHKDNWKERGML